MEAGNLDGDSTACSWLGGTGSLDACGNGRLGVLAAWLLVARMMRVGIRMLMNDDKDESWKEFSHARA